MLRVLTQKNLRMYSHTIHHVDSVECHECVQATIISGRHPDNSRANTLAQNHQRLGSSTQCLGTTTTRPSLLQSERQMEASFADEVQGTIIAETQDEPSMPEFQCNPSSKQPVS